MTSSELSSELAEIKPRKPGQFLPGQVNNPRGRPKIGPSAKVLARNYTKEAIETLAQIMRNKKAKDKDRIAAADSILDRAWGKPVTHNDDDTRTDNHLGAMLVEVMKRSLLGSLNSDSENPESEVLETIDITPNTDDIYTCTDNIDTSMDETANNTE